MSEQINRKSSNEDAETPESDDVEQHGIEVEDDSEAAKFDINIGCS